MVTLTPPREKKLALSVLCIVYVLVMVWGLWLEQQPDKATVWNFLFNVGYALLFFAGALTGLIGAWRVGIRTVSGKAMLFLGASLLSQTLALITWAYYNIVLKVAIPSPSLGDLFFLVFFLPLVIIAFVYLFRLSEAALTPFSISLALVIFVISLGVIFGIVERPDISGNHTLIASLISVGYPFIDCILLSFAVFILTVVPPKFRKGFLILFLGFLVQVAGDITYAIRIGNGTYWNGDLADKIYASAAFVISFGTIWLFYWLMQQRLDGVEAPAQLPTVDSTPPSAPSAPMPTIPTPTPPVSL